VKDVLIDMKNSCGLMLDLAYASLFLNDEDLAEEVLEIERDIDSLLYEIWASASLAVRDVEDAEALAGIMKLAISIDGISNAVADIVNVIRLKLGLPSQLKEALSRIEPQYRRITVVKGSPIVGRSLGELGLDVNMGVFVLAIRRGAKIIIDPEDSETIFEGDILIVRGPIDGLNDLSRIASGEVKDLREVFGDEF
jgi:uncharacterized protein with PhoU and TrkA domain